jgi:hypothetical protein
MDATEFAAALRAKGIELIVRGNRLSVWPKGAWTGGLDDANRNYIRDHRAELKALVLAGLPETTVVWQPANAVADAAPQRSNTPVEPSPPCQGCDRSPCVGPDHWAFDTLHPNDVVVVQRELRTYTEQMTASMRRERERR